MLLHTTSETGQPAVYINGGSIAARSIYSAQIQANAIIAEHLRAGQISSDHISTAGITADNIKGKTLSSSVPVSSGGSFINLDTGNINFAGGNLTWNNTTKTFYINASTLQIGGKNVLDTDTDLAQQINNKGTTRIQGNKLHFTNQVLMDDAFIELLTANNIFAQRVDAREINANRITSGTLAADFIQGGTFDGQSMIVKNITADAIKGGTFDGQSMTIKNLTADAIVAGTLDMSKFTVANLSADAIQTGNLDISGGLRVTAGRHQVMSIDPETLVLEFNVNKMTIGGIKLISEDDRPQMEENIANELEDKIKPYLHIAYANNATGTLGFSITDSLNKLYIGTYTDYIKIDSKDPSKYKWTLIKGDKGEQGPRGLTGAQGQQGDQGIKGADGTDGLSSYTHIAYADTITGAGFSHSDASKPFIGIYADDKPTSSGTASKYTWSKWHGEDGSDGIQGPKGTDGLPSYTHFAYANNATGTSGFSTTDSLNKSYLGIYTDNTKADSEVPSKYTWTLIKGATGARGPEGIQGLQGPKGDQGIKGNTGADGKTSYTHIAYADNATGTLNFSTSDSNREYVGMYTDFKATDSSEPSLYNWSLIKGRDGSEGIQGPQGPEGKTPYLHIAYANNSTGTSGFSVNDSANKLYIGTYTDFTSTDSTDPSKYSWTLIKGDKGDKGETGPRGATGSTGPRGDTGTSVESITEYYLATNASSGVTTNTSGWVTTIPTMNTTNKYLWNYEKINFSDGTNQPTIPVIIGVHGATGATGGTGATGRSITGITEHYLATASASGVTRTTSGWTTTMQSTTPTNKYLWNYETITWSSGTTTTYVEPIIIGIHGETGATGAKGETGPQGVSITKVDVQYYLSTSNTSLVGGSWSTTAPAWVDGRFMWSKTVTTYSSGSPTESKPVCITGAKGTTGSTGSTGATGRGISSIVEQFYLSTSKTTQTGGSWSTTMPTWSPGKYVWTRSYITYTTGTPATGTTTPLVSSEWEAINEIEIGGRNLLKNSGEEVSNGTYNIASYDLTDAIKEGEEVTLTIWGSLAATKSYFSAYNSGGSINLTTLTDNGNGTYSRTFNWKIGSSTNTYLNVYAFTNSQTGTSTINKIKLERGNTATDWTEAPEDTQSKIDDKASAEDLTNASNDLNTSIGDLSNTVDGKLDKSAYEEFLEYNADLQQQVTESIGNAKEDIGKALDRTAIIEQTLGEGAADWIFTNTRIRMSDEGITLGEEGSGSYLQISDEQISFFNGSKEPVAFINGGMLHINHAIFVESIQISQFMFSSEISGHLTLRYVGN